MRMKLHIRWLGLLFVMSCGNHDEDERRWNLSREFHEALEKLDDACPEDLANGVAVEIDNISGAGNGCYPKDSDRVERCVRMMNYLRHYHVCTIGPSEAGEPDGIDHSELVLACESVYPPCSIAYDQTAS